VQALLWLDVDIEQNFSRCDDHGPAPNAGSHSVTKSWRSMVSAAPPCVRLAMR
jgi:hypothetical protein